MVRDLILLNIGRDILTRDLDVFQSGVVVTTVSAVILVLCTLYIGLLLADSSRRTGVSTRTLVVQYATLGFFALWLFATQIPLTVFVTTRSIKVTAFIDGLPLPNNIVNTIERALGAKTKYSSYDYRASYIRPLKPHTLISCSTVKLLAILPWFAFLFTLVAAVVAFMASSHARRHAKAEPVSSTGKELPLIGANKELPPNPETPQV